MEQIIKSYEEIINEISKITHTAEQMAQAGAINGDEEAVSLGTDVLTDIDEIRTRVFYVYCNLKMQTHKAEKEK